MRVIDLASLSMVGGSGIAETKIPLWWDDGGGVAFNSTQHWGLIYDGNDGSNYENSSTPISSNNLFTLSSNWTNNTSFAFEATVDMTSGGGQATIQLKDNTTNTVITTVTTTSTTAQVIRSGTFTLTTGHSYGVWVDTNSTTYGYIFDASLIVFPQ